MDQESANALGTAFVGCVFGLFVLGVLVGTFWIHFKLIAALFGKDTVMDRWQFALVFGLTVLSIGLWGVTIPLILLLCFGYAVGWVFGYRRTAA